MDGEAVRGLVHPEMGHLAIPRQPDPNVAYTLAPQRIVIGGGISGLPELFPRIRGYLATTLGAYPGLPEHVGDDFVVPPGLGPMAGPLGAIALAADAAGR